MHDYLSWLTRWHHLFETYANLDVIGDPEQTWLNQKAMESAGFAPVPVFHYGAPWEYLDRYLDAGYPYIALGAMVGAQVGVRRWIVQCFIRARGRAVFHGFGRTNIPEMRDLPWYSVDSSSWSQGFRFGHVQFFDGGKWLTVDVGDHAAIYGRAALIRAHGIEPAQIADRKLYHWKYACHASAIGWHRASIWMHKRHAPVPVPARDSTTVQRDVGPHIYLADTTRHRLKCAAEAIRDVKEHP